MSHPNIDRLKTGYEAFSKGDMETIDGLWADDIRWNSYGNTPFAGVFEGKPAIFSMLATIPQMTDQFDLEIHDILANDHHGTVLIEQTTRRGDQVFQGRAVHMYHFTDGMVTEAWIQPIDETAVPEGFWD